MSDEIRFKKRFTRSYGRNGLYKTIGVFIGRTYSVEVKDGEEGHHGAISITGLNSRGIPASGDLNIPIDDIGAFIEMLKTYQR